MVQVSIFLGAFPEKCNIWRLAQRSCAAVGSHVRPRKMLCWKFWSDRKEKQGLVSVSGCKHFSMIFFFCLFPTAVKLSVWLVCLAPFLSKLWKFCWKLVLPLLLSFFFFFLFSFLFCFLVLHMDCDRELSFRWEPKNVAEKLLIEPSFLEGEGVSCAGVPGNSVGSWSAANPEVLAAACFCTHCLLTGADNPALTYCVSFTFQFRRGRQLNLWF